MATLSQRTELTDAADADLMHVVDVSDTTDSANGTSKKITKENLLKDVVRKTGWGNYPDSQYTAGSPFSLVADTPTILPNNRGSVLLNEAQKPTDIDTFYCAGYIDIDGITSAFVIGETVTGGTSGATAVVVSTTGARLLLTTISGTFVDDEAVTGSSGGAAVVNGAMGAGYILGQDQDSYNIILELKAVPQNVNATLLEIWIDIGGAVGELYRRLVTFPKGNGEIRPVTLTTAVYTLDTWEANGGTVYAQANGPMDVYDIRFVIYRTHKAV